MKNIIYQKINFTNFHKTFFFLAIIILFGCKDSVNEIEIINKNFSKAFVYTIKPISLEDRVNLDIEVVFKGNASGITEVSLPVDKYGTDNIYEAVASFAVENAIVKTVFKKPEIRVLEHKPNQELVINYTISFDPELSSTSSFSPIIESEMFHFFSPQWTLRTGNNEKQYNYSIQFKDLPKDWVAYSNLTQGSDNHFIANVKQKDFKPFIAGGNYRHTLTTIQGKPVNVIISHHFKNDNLLEDVTRLMKIQRDFLDFETNEHYLVSITKRDRILAGTAIENSFVCLMRKDAQKHKVLDLLAHETLHNWVPLMADIERDMNVIGSEYSTEFFNEGFIAYAPRVLMYENDLISKENVIELMNKTLYEYAKNPYSNITLSKIQKVEQEGKFNNKHEKVSYYRGELLAFQWDNIIRAKTNNQENILHFVKSVISKALETGGKISFEDFHNIASGYGIDSKTNWIEHIQKGEMISLNNAGWLNDDYKLELKKDSISNISYQTFTKI
ncbi:MAG: hypothetical protein KDD03_11865 [Gelidibacter sp.]|nr:hypothetical protein [Gelidibacter sp.]